MALPQFGIKSSVRVCDDCFDLAQKSSVEENVSQVDNDASKAAASISSLDLSPNGSPPVTEERPSVAPESQSFECTCGMPLCICQAPIAPQVIPSTQVVTPIISKKSMSVSSTAYTGAAKPSASSSNLPSLFFSSTQVSNGGNHPIAKTYAVSQEGMREAIKDGDVSTVKDFLTKGIDPNHLDKQGMSLLHLAAVFNFTDIALLLIDAGAKVDVKNAQGETPVDCAQATLQYKMQQKIRARANNV